MIAQQIHLDTNKFPAYQVQQVLSHLEIQTEKNASKSQALLAEELCNTSILLDGYVRKYGFNDRVAQGFIKRFDKIMKFQKNTKINSICAPQTGPISKQTQELRNKNPEAYDKLKQFYCGQFYHKALNNFEQDDYQTSHIFKMKQQLREHKKNYFGSKVLKIPTQVENQLEAKESLVKYQKNSTEDGLSENQIHLNSFYQKIFKHYSQHELDDAHELIIKYRKLLSKESNPERFQEKVNHSEKNLKKIQKQYQMMINFYKNFQITGWELQFKQKLKNGHLEFYTKHFKENDQIGFMIEGQFDIPIENFLAILTQVDLMDKYVPFAYDTNQLKKVQRNHKVALARVYIPFLTDRQIYFSAYGYNRMNTTNSVFIYSRTVTYDQQFKKQHEINIPSDQESKLVRMVYNFFIVQYTPLSRTRAKVRIANNLDLKFKFLPYFLIYKTTVKFGTDYFRNVIKVNQKFQNSQWERKMKENPQLYQFFRKKINEKFPQ